MIEELREQVAKLTALVEKQAARIAELELALAKAKKDSSTSSKPPSSDLTKPKPKQSDFDILQQIELPTVPVHVTEHRLAIYVDADGNLHIPDCPELKGPPRLLPSSALRRRVRGKYSNNWWAHLIRDIRFLSEKHPDAETKAWAEKLLERSRRLFSAWHRRDEMTAEGFHRSMLTHRDRFLELVLLPL